MTIAPPRVSRLVVVLAIGVGAVGGCGGGSAKKNYVDAAFGTGGGGPGVGGAAVGAGGTLGGGGHPVTGSGGATLGTGGSASDAGVAAPDAPPAPTNTLLFGGITALIGPGLSCSRSVVATGAVAPDRWCGIATVPSSAATTVSLAVFNLTKALAGMPITCTATDPNCLILSTSLALTADAAHGFNGQTLIYYEDTAIYAWRPGWTAGRKLIALTSTLRAHCEASSTDVAAAICFQLDGSVTDGPVAGYAGVIDTQTGPLLPGFEPALGTNLGFSPDSLSVIWSASTSTTTPAETLKMQKIGSGGAPTSVATNITSWGLSADGTSWLWLSAPTVDTKTKLMVGTLQAAPFPAGTAPVALQTKTYDYVPFGTKGVTVMANPTAAGTDLKTFPDVTAATPAGTVLEPADAYGIIDVDANGMVLFYNDLAPLDDTGTNNLVNLRIVKADGTGKCAVTVDAVADPSASITRPGTGVAWAQVTIDTSGGVTAVEGQVTTLADCTAHPFSPTISGFIDVMTGLVYSENHNADALTADINYGLFGTTGALNPKMQIQREADLSYEALFPEIPRVLFTLNARATGNGVYISPVLTGIATAPSLAATPTARPLASAAQGLMRTSGLRVPAAGSASLAKSLGLKIPAGPRARSTATALRGFGRGAKATPSLPLQAVRAANGRARP